jgi:predicted secreted protein
MTNTRHQKALIFLPLLTLGACVSSSNDDDGADDSFIVGEKADGFGIESDSADAFAIYRLVSTASAEVLKEQVQLGASAANNILQARAGADAQLGTADDVWIFSLEQLDAIPYVGPTAFEKLLAYADSTLMIAEARSTDRISVLGGGFLGTPNIEVEEGQNFLVMLPASPEAGITWNVTATDRTLGYPSREFARLAIRDNDAVSGLELLTWRTRTVVPTAGVHQIEMTMQGLGEEVKVAAKVTIKPAPGATVIGTEQNGETVEVKLGHEAVFRLPLAASDGHGWRLATTSRTLGYPGKVARYADSQQLEVTWGTDPLEPGSQHVVIFENTRDGSTFSATIKVVP